MRCDQYIGLNYWANKMLYDHRQTGVMERWFYPDETEIDDPKPFLVDSVRTRIPTHKIEIIGKIEGAWNPHVADLRRFTLEDGTIYEEYIQAEPWSSGPCYFIALKDSEGNPVPESLWTDEEIANA
jgi:hypothetical protein